MTLSGQEFHDLCEQHDLGAHAGALQAWLQARIGYSRGDDAAAAVGASRIGGGPDVPSGFEWPTHNGRVLDFMLQVNLADLQGLVSDLELPGQGVMAFFYDVQGQPWGFDPAHVGGHRVYLFENQDLHRLPVPDAAMELPPSSLAFHQAWSLPQPYSMESEALLGVLAASGSEVDEDSYEGLVDAVSDHGAPIAGQRHVLGGYPSSIQGDMKLEAQLVSHGICCGHPEGYEDRRRAELEEGAHDWRLLLQMDSDDDAMWGDSGILYWWIRRQDLAARDVSRTWLGLQCY